MLSREHGIDLHFSREIYDAWVCIDFRLVLQVFENMLSNAVRYARTGIEINCGLDQGILAISVRDDGKGFSGEDLRQAAKPFYMDKNPGEELHLGMGLYICKVLCEKQGGRLLLENSGKGGACVTAQFPVCPGN